MVMGGRGKRLQKDQSSQGKDGEETSKEKQLLNGSEGRKDTVNLPTPVWFFWFFFFFFFFGFLGFFFLPFLRLLLRHMEVPRLGVESELKLLVYIRATATPDPSHVCNLHQSLTATPDP